MARLFNGKALYQPKGKAGEYAKWACNFYNGCSNGCEYCYCKQGVLAHVMGGSQPTLKKCFKDEKDALNTFIDEVASLDAQQQESIERYGILFTFTSDPCLSETYALNLMAIQRLTQIYPALILTKCTEWIDTTMGQQVIEHNTMRKHNLAVGFTLTGHDELEPNAATNAERIAAMKRLHDMGITTWASIEPIIDLESSMEMIRQTCEFCDHYKIGILKGKKYDYMQLRSFAAYVAINACRPIYFKDSFLAAAKVDRQELMKQYRRCVDADYSIFHK